MQEMVDKNEIAGAVTTVVSKEKVMHLESTGHANVEQKKSMTPETVFWIASMTKPVTAAAVLMLQDEGKLRVTDPVAKYIPEFANLKTPSGKPANLTIVQILNHTSGLGEAFGDKAREAKTLADLVPIWLSTPMRHEPGEKWSYNQSGINAAGRIVEILSGKTFDKFLEDRLFKPLGMKDTAFYLNDQLRGRLVTAYSKNKETAKLEPVAPRPEFGPKDRPPQGNGGLYSTAPDYARFCQMLLNNGRLDGKPYLSGEAMTWLTQPTTGELPTGFMEQKNYGWGLATCILKTPHSGTAEALSAGSYGHGGAWGTQAWIDPAKGVAYILMVQRSNFPNSDNSDVRRAFQNAAAAALGKK